MKLVGKKFENAKLGMDLFVYDVGGVEMFIGKNMCGILEYGNSREAIKKHVWDKEKTTLYVKTLENTEKSQNVTSQTINNNMTLITETGLYQLIFRSKMPKAEEFQEWVFTEVLPSIRKNNYYVNEIATREQLDEAQKAITKLQILSGVIKKFDKGEYAISSVSEVVFNGNRAALKRKLIEDGYITDKDTVICSYSVDAEGRKIPILLQKVSQRTVNGEIKTIKSIRVTALGRYYFMNKYGDMKF